MTYFVCPDYVRRTAEPRIRDMLIELCKALALPRAVLSFVSDDGRFEFRDALITDPSQLLAQFRAHEGLMGHSLKEDRIAIYPLDRGSAERFLNIDRRTIFEISAPIRYEGKPAAVLLVDYFLDEKPPSIDQQFYQSLADFCERVATLLNEAKHRDARIEIQMRDIVERCRTLTVSKRGYVAVKNLDGRVRYFTRDTDEDIFLPLNQTEGICGKVFQTGKAINADNVWAEPSYIASDKSINSEIVIPILSDKEVVAVVNMESEKRNYYTSRREALVREAAADLEGPVREYRRRDEMNDQTYAVAISDLIEQAIIYPEQRETRQQITIDVIDLVLRKASFAFNAVKQVRWLTDRDPPPKEMDSLKWHSHLKEGVVSVEDDKRFLIYAPINSGGELIAVVGLLVRSRPNDSGVRVFEQFCRIGGRLIDNRLSRNRLVVFPEIVSTILGTSQDSVSLDRLVFNVRDFMECDQCSLFGVVDAGAQKVLCVVASTSDAVFEDTRENMFYRIDPTDGLTGYVASSREELILDNLDTVKEERPAADGQPRWKRKISEQKDRDITSFIGMPILCDEARDLIGVLRLHRSRDRGRGTFDEDSIGRLRTIVRVLGIKYCRQGFLTGRKGGKVSA